MTTVTLARSVATLVLVCVTSLTAMGVASRPDTVSIDRRTDKDEPGTYYVAFVATKGNIGHAYVNLFGHDEVAKVSFDEAFGLYPDEKPTLWRLTKVPGTIVNEERDTRNNTRLRLVVRVNRAQIERVRVYRDEFTQECNQKACSWQLLVSDCVTFMREASRLAGMQLPSRFLDSPFAAVTELINANL